MIGPALIAAGDLWSLVVPIVFFIIYALNHLLSAKGNRPPARTPQRRPPEQAQRPPRPPQPQGQPADPLTGGPSQLNAEIEQFLKRATERRGDRAVRERAANVKPPPKAPQKPLRDTRREQPLDVEPLAQRELSSVAASVEKHMADRGFTSRAEHLADDIVRADQQMESHLQKAFGHRVGTLPDSAPKASATPATDSVPQVVEGISPVAAGVVAILADPKNIRQAIVLSEILERPEHRW